MADLRALIRGWNSAGENCRLPALWKLPTSLRVFKQDEGTTRAMAPSQPLAPQLEREPAQLPRQQLSFHFSQWNHRHNRLSKKSAKTKWPQEHWGCKVTGFRGCAVWPHRWLLTETGQRQTGKAVPAKCPVDPRGSLSWGWNWFCGLWNSNLFKRPKL